MNTQEMIEAILYNYEQSVYPSENYSGLRESLDHCLTLLKAEAEGRLLILPKTLYEADSTPLIMGVIEWKVTGVRYYDGTVRAYTVQTKNVQSIIYEREIGETVFFTHEEAEAALKEGTN